MLGGVTGGCPLWNGIDEGFIQFNMFIDVGDMSGIRSNISIGNPYSSQSHNRFFSCIYNKLLAFYEEFKPLKSL
jgi:hypothetical protein